MSHNVTVVVWNASLKTFHIAFMHYCNIFVDDELEKTMLSEPQMQLLSSTTDFDENLAIDPLPLVVVYIRSAPEERKKREMLRNQFWVRELRAAGATVHMR